MEPLQTRGAPSTGALPRVSTELPGPRPRELLGRLDRVIHGPLRDSETVPFVLGRKHGHLLEDVDGNTFTDHVSAWGEVAEAVAEVAATI